MRTKLDLAIRFLAFVAICFGIKILPAARAEDTKEALEHFERHVRPLLIKKCYGCHREPGSQANTGEPQSEDAPPLETPEPSLLLERILESDDALRMPPPGTGSQLNDTEVEIIKAWLALGGVWPATNTVLPTAVAIQNAAREHWAFQPPQHLAPPVLADDAATNPIDAFIRHRQQAMGLAHAPAADRRTLIRRASYDLHGLPPSYEDVKQFEANSEPDAYEQLIDRMLASPRYGEQWARHWLDIARYSDTKGYVYDREERFFTHSALYRDWVIQAFNDDMPYDRFVQLQLAADQIEPDETTTWPALGFLTLGRRFLGVQPDIIDDRIDVVGRGLLGLTIGCARCHDHKYDPIPATDYYALYGVFMNCADEVVAIADNSTDDKTSKEYATELQRLQQEFDELYTQTRDEMESRIRNSFANYLYAQHELDQYPETAFSLVTSKDDILPGIVRRWESLLKQSSSDPVFSLWHAYNAIPDSEFEAKAPDVVSASQQAGLPMHPLILKTFDTPPHSLKQVAERYGQVLANVDDKWQALVAQHEQQGMPVPVALPDPDEETLRQVLYGPHSLCSIPDESIVNTEWYWDTPTVEKLFKKQAEVDRWIIKDPLQAKRIVVPRDRTILVEPRVFRRGNPANKGALVARRFVQFLSEQKPGHFQHGSGRLELAQAITNPSNPLTARVWVNRVWRYHFGKGLSDSPSDFGLRANSPSHPELLDWLASEFMAHGWSNRWLHRTILLSQTYQQSAHLPRMNESTASASDDLADTSNRWLTRMQPKRLSLEEMRDTLTLHAEEHDAAMGGKPLPWFDRAANQGFRRSIYSLVDRQYLPTVLSVFDFANPELHAPERINTTVPQQALFQLNHPFVAACSRSVAERLQQAGTLSANDQVQLLYRIIYQRHPNESELQAAREYLSNAKTQQNDWRSIAAQSWSYGYGSIDNSAGRTLSFTPLPHGNATTWQGGPELPDSELGWVHMTASLTHAGNDLEHTAIRRWTAPGAGTLSIRSNISHEHEQGDGARATLVSSRHGILRSEVLFQTQQSWAFHDLRVEPGDTLDFAVQLHGSLNYEDLAWQSELSLMFDEIAPSQEVKHWNSTEDFRTREHRWLSPLEQLAQLMMISNEAMFVD